MFWINVKIKKSDDSKANSWEFDEIIVYSLIFFLEFVRDFRHKPSFAREKKSQVKSEISRELHLPESQLNAI